MADTDWGIVVGISKYPELDSLDGSENDAQDFYDWLISPAGGKVPEKQVALILSSQFPPVPKATRAEPSSLRIQQAFEDLQDVAKMNEDAGNGLQTGRRFYIYLSGHGCAPRFDDSALLAANATRERAGYHILGKLFANWFLRSNFFEEVALFMDCCRENVAQVPPSIPPWVDITGVEGVDKARTFFGFGTKWARLSRERLMPDGKVHGVFTWALLQGLKGEACDPATGDITARSLGDYLYNHMKAFLSAQDLEDPDIPKEPDLQYDANPASPLVFCKVPVPQYAVTIQLPPTAAGKQVQILDNKFAVAAAANGVPPLWQTQLRRGIYLAQIQSLGLQTQAFEVNGGAVNVSF
jgi:Caspase domain